MVYCGKTLTGKALRICTAYRLQNAVKHAVEKQSGATLLVILNILPWQQMV